MLSNLVRVVHDLSRCKLIVGNAVRTRNHVQRTAAEMDVLERDPGRNQVAGGRDSHHYGVAMEELLGAIFEVEGLNDHRWLAENQLYILE